MANKNRKKLAQDQKVINILSKLELDIKKIEEDTWKSLEAERKKLEEGIYDGIGYKNSQAELIQMKQFAILNKKQEATRTLYFNYNYNITTEDISILLDLQPLYITRNLRDYYIRSCEIPHVATLEEHLSMLDYIKISKKKFLYSREDLYYFIKNYLYKEDRYIYLNIKDIFEEIELDKYLIQTLSQQYIHKLTEKHKDKKHIKINAEDFENIMNDKTQLLRLDSVKEIVKYNILRDRYTRALRKIKESGWKQEVKDKEKQKVEKELYGFKDEICFNAKNLKKANMINQKQLERFIKKRAHTKYNLILKENENIHIALYAIEDDDIVNKNNEGEIAISESLLDKLGEEEIKRGIIEYIQKNKNKTNQELEDF